MLGTLLVAVTSLLVATIGSAVLSGAGEDRRIGTPSGCTR